MESNHASTIHSSLTSLRLVATDLDGTLLRSDKTISVRTLAVFRRLQAAGVMLVLVSARPPRTVRLFMKDTNIGGLALCCNGAILYDLDRDCLLHQQALAPEQVEHIITHLHASLPGIAFASESGLSVSGEAAYFSYRSKHENVPPRTVEASVLWRAPSMKLMVRHDTLSIEALHERIAALLDSRLYSVTYSSTLFVEIALAGVQKGAALAAFCAQHRLKAHEVIAFGDMPNDLPLLDWAGLGVAVANAHPLVLQAADAITLSNDEDGVAYMLEQLLEHTQLKKGRGL